MQAVSVRGDGEEVGSGEGTQRRSLDKAVFKIVAGGDDAVEGSLTS